MTKVLVHAYSEYRAHITSVLFVASLVMLAIYAMNVYSVIARTVSLQKIEMETNALSSSVAHLDSNYLELSGKITPDTIRAHGFNQSEVSEYISRTASLGRVAVAGHEL